MTLAKNRPRGILSNALPRVHSFSFCIYLSFKFLSLSSILDNSNSDTNSGLWKVLFAVFIGVFFVVVPGLVGYILYLKCCKRDQRILQVGNFHDGGENHVANGYAIRYVNSQASNGSPRIANGSERNSVANGRTVGNVYSQASDGGPHIGKGHCSEGSGVANGDTVRNVNGPSIPSSQ